MPLVALGCTANAGLESRVAALEKANQTLRLELELAELKMQAAELRLTEITEAPLDPAEPGFASVRTNNGQLVVSCDNVVPFGDGQKVTLRIGNPYAMTFRGLGLTIRYGSRAPRDPAPDSFTLEQSTAREKWSKSLRAKDMTLPDVLVPGSWTDVSFVLAPARPEDVGFIGVRISTNEISLRGR